MFASLFSTRSVQHLNRIAGTDDALSEHGTINASRAFVTSRDGAQDLGVRRSGIGIQRDHLAPGIPLKSGNDNLGSYPYSMPNQSILKESLRRSEIQIHIRAEAALVEDEANLPPQLLRSLQRKKRDRAAIRHRPLRS